MSLSAHARSALLALHRALVERERRDYEKIHGRVSDADFLQGLIHDPAFAWLTPFTTLIVRLEELDDEGNEADAAAALAALRELLILAPERSEFIERTPSGSIAIPTSPSLTASPLHRFAKRSRRNRSRAAAQCLAAVYTLEIYRGCEQLTPYIADAMLPRSCTSNCGGDQNEEPAFVRDRSPSRHCPHARCRRPASRQRNDDASSCPVHAVGMAANAHRHGVRTLGKARTRGDVNSLCDGPRGDAGAAWRASGRRRSRSDAAGAGRVCGPARSRVRSGCPLEPVEGSRAGR